MNGRDDCDRDNNYKKKLFHGKTLSRPVILTKAVVASLANLILYGAGIWQRTSWTRVENIIFLAGDVMGLDQGCTAFSA